MGCLSSLPLTVKGPDSDSGGRLVCVGVGVSISVEGCVDASTSPSMMSSSRSSSPSSSSCSSLPCCSSRSYYCSSSSSNHARASSMIGISTSTLHLDNTSILSKEMASTSSVLSICFNNSWRL
jgi:hypothetical protein